MSHTQNNTRAPFAWHQVPFRSHITNGTNQTQWLVHDTGGTSNPNIMITNNAPTASCRSIHHAPTATRNVAAMATTTRALIPGS